jgi:hypothetical protein
MSIYIVLGISFFFILSFIIFTIWKIRKETKRRVQEEEFEKWKTEKYLTLKIDNSDLNALLKRAAGGPKKIIPSNKPEDANTSIEMTSSSVLDNQVFSEVATVEISHKHDYHGSGGHFGGAGSTGGFESHPVTSHETTSSHSHSSSNDHGSSFDSSFDSGSGSSSSND